jgi:hypothetical protein
MKNLTKNFAIGTMSLLVSTLLLSSCSKADDPTPIVATQTNTTSTAPVFSATKVSLTNGAFTIPVSSPSNKTLTISSVVSDTNITVSTSGLTATVSTKHKIFYGDATATISVSDGTNTTTQVLTISVGTTEQINSYNLLKPYLYKSLTGDVGSLFMKLDGTVTSKPNADFWLSATCYGSYEIMENGHFLLNTANNKISYTEYVLSIELTHVPDINIDINRLTFTNVKDTFYKYKVSERYL